MASSDKVKVAVRVRPFNRREIDLGTKCVVDMENDQTILYHPTTGLKDTKDSNEVQHIPVGSKKPPKTFAFDNCFWSMDENVSKFANQENVFNALGKSILERAFEGYNACIFAYGQTGSGKSYTMMGTFDDKGIIPRLCDTLFNQIADNTDAEVEYKVEVSYMEIYNERVRDLLDPKGKHNLKVREHNILGPYVDGMSTLAVSSFKDIDSLMSEGNKSRTVAATNMNSESSRSHAVFSIILTAIMTDTQSGVSGEKVSKMSLVDLAGSERAQKTGAVGDRLKEGSNINKSLTTLGLVISALADSGSSKSGKMKFVPYRDSVLTWLLKDNLGGNSKTVMVATVSPSADNYEETLSTLRYADRAKRIVNHAVVNEDPNARIIRELREEVEELRKMLDDAQSHKQDNVVREKLAESEKLFSEMSKTWEQKLMETEQIHQERQLALEKMGISVQSSGIKVGTGKYYLVNLNADPSLNELLVYYLKESTLVGRPGAPKEQDIQLSGLGIDPEHAVIEIEEAEVYVKPLVDSRTCLNGKTITGRTRCKHGDRLLLGNYHFFRINCPKTNSPCTETPQNIDYEFAQQEVMFQEYGNDPIQAAITDLEKEHEKDKEAALQKQRQMYEWEMQKLKNQLMSPGTPSAPYPPFFADPFRTPTGAPPGSGNTKYQHWAEEKECMFKQSLQKLKGEVLKANTLVREANFLAQEMGKKTEFSVTLQIPAANLTPNRKRGSFVSEPAILVKRQSQGAQVWEMDKFENKIIDMRDMYEERKERGPLLDEGPPQKGDPFYESQENHNLIGVANVYLESLFYDAKLDYHVPIISQQGEVAGKLHMELCRVAGVFPQDRQGDADSESSSGEGSNRNSMTDGDDDSSVALGSSIVTQVCIKSARGLPPSLSHFVFCQYSFWNHPDPMVVPPIVNPDIVPPMESGVTFKFDHKKEFGVHVTEEFVEHCTEGALSIEVWGHRSTGFENGQACDIDNLQAKSRSIMDRWSELTRKIEVWTEIHELNEQGEYVPVEVAPRPEVLTGGVFQLRQGHSRRVLTHVKPVQNSGTLPLIVECIHHVSIGCVTARSKLQKGLDSYQEEDLTILRSRWSDALEKRREYLDEQLQRIMNKEEKTESDKDRERSLIEQWVSLTEERNAVLVPAAGSGIPGAPADWEPPQGMEEHIPVIFLDLNAEDMTTPTAKEGNQASGINSILPKEHGAKFFVLPFVQNSERNITSLVSWDSSIHDSVHLNRVTPQNERVYLVLKVVIRLSHPAAMELVLRKRICINVYKRQGFTEKLRKRMVKADNMVGSGVTYEIVSNIPKASEDLEDRESLAQIAATQNDLNDADGETYIEKYIKGVSAVESILQLDRLRQEVTIKEQISHRGKPLAMRKATSVPNINSIASPVDNRSGSISDLNFEFNPERFGVGGGMPKQYSLDALKQRMDSNKDILPNKPFSLARPNFLNLRSNMLHQAKTSPLAGVSPQPTKQVKPMKTVVEEQQSKPLLNRGDDEYDIDFEVPPMENIEESDEDEFAQYKIEQEELSRLKSNDPTTADHDSDEFTPFQSYQANGEERNQVKQEENQQQQQQQLSSSNYSSTVLPHSSTNDSLSDVPAIKISGESVASSGYGSQAVSIQTLSSEDSASIRSLEEVENDKNTRQKAQSTGVSISGNCPDTTTTEAMVEGGVTKNGDIRNVDLLADIDSKKGHKGLTTPALLLDSDCPSNLGTPLEPLSPEEEEGGEAGDNTPVVNTTESSEDTAPQHSTSNTVIQYPHQEQTEQPVVTTPQPVVENYHFPLSQNQDPQEESDSNDKTIDDNNEGSKSNTKEADGDVSTDIYSDNMLDDLEQFDAGVNYTFSSPAVPQLKQQQNCSSVHIAESTPIKKHIDRHLENNEHIAESTPVKSLNYNGDGGVGEENDSANLTLDGNDSIITSSVNEDDNVCDNSSGGDNSDENEAEVKLRENGNNKKNGERGSSSQKRRSWTDTSDIQNSTIPEDTLATDTSLSSSPSEVKLRKGGTIDISRPLAAHAKKTQGGGVAPGGGSGGGKPQPMKATYRPVSMPVEMLSVEQDGMGGGSSHDENDSENEDSASICSFGSRADLNRLGEVPVPAWIQVGEPVQVLFSTGGSKTGTVLFVGTTEFAGGNWVGVELDTPDGKNDGAVKGVRYFKTKNRHGVFVRHDKIIMDKRRRGSKGRNSITRKSTGNLAAVAAAATTTPPSRERSTNSTLSPSANVPSFMKATSSSANKLRK